MLINQMRAGALDLILVYRSNAVSNPENIEKYLDIVEMNLKEAVAIQPFAVAKDTQHPYLMRRLLEAILAPESQERFRKAGFHWIAERKAEGSRHEPPHRGRLVLSPCRSSPGGGPSPAPTRATGCSLPGRSACWAPTCS